MKSNTITVRIKVNEMPKVRKAAKFAGQSISAYIRSCVMNDFRTMVDPGEKDAFMSEAINRLNQNLKMFAEIEMGAGLAPVPPTPGVTNTPPPSSRAGRKGRAGR